METIQKITTRSLEKESVVVSYLSHTDTTSNGFGIPFSCGPIVYDFLVPPPSYMSFDYLEGDTSFTVTVDVADYANSGTDTIKLVVALENYPTLAKSYSEFIVTVLPGLDTWVPPPPPAPPKPNEAPRPVIAEDIVIIVPE
jgi:hypothetical protein